MATAQFTAQMNMLNSPPHPEPQQVPIMEDVESANNQIEYGNAGQHPPGSVRPKGNLWPAMTSTNWTHSFLIIGFVLLIIVFGALFMGAVKGTKK